MLPDGVCRAGRCDVVQPPVQQVSYAAWVALAPVVHLGEEQGTQARVAQTAEQRTRNA